MGNQMMVYAEEAQKRASELTLPILVMHGSDDKMASPKGSHLVFKEARSQDKTLKIWDGMYHEIFNEIGKDASFASPAIGWMRG